MLGGGWLPATDALKSALATEANAGTDVAPINTICLFNGTTQVKCVSLASADFTVDTANNKLKVVKEITNDTGSNQTFDRVVLRSGTTSYFITTVSATSFPINATVRIEWELTVSGSLSASGYFNGGNVEGLVDMIIRILAGQRGAKDSLLLNRFVYLDTGVTPIAVLLGVAATRAISGTSVTASHDYANFTAGGTLRECWVLNELAASDTDSAARIAQITTTSPASVDTTMAINHSFTVTF